jgi:K+-transporting ATPase KdpF subunit
MNLLYLVAGLISLALLIYLVLALLKPEWFD